MVKRSSKTRSFHGQEVKKNKEFFMVKKSKEFFMVKKSKEFSWLRSPQKQGVFMVKSTTTRSSHG